MVCPPKNRTKSAFTPVVSSVRSLRAAAASGSLAGNRRIRDHRWYSEVVNDELLEMLSLQVTTAVSSRVRSNALLLGRNSSSKLVFGIWKFVSCAVKAHF